MHRLARSFASAAVALVLAGCGSSAEPASGSTSATPVSLGAAVPDFSLLDVNPASPTAGHLVSPRDYAKQVSAWYFGHST